MDDLITWLRACLDEDEENARYALAWFQPADFDIRWNWSADYRRTHEHAGRSGALLRGAPTPESVLADIAAKRATVDLHTIWTKPEMEIAGGPIPEVRRSGTVTLTTYKPGPPQTIEPTGRTLYVCGTCDCGGDEEYYSPGIACPTLLWLASVCAARPGYLESWRPGGQST